MSAALAREARQFLFSTRHAILSTLSAKYPGYPFGSVAPFVANHQAEPIILISTIAEHTKNIQANPRVSLLVFEGAEDLQANARLTLIGEAIACDKNDGDLRARYLRYLPQAANYFDMHDFMFYRIRVDQVRYIAGFGKMGWFEGNQLSADLGSTELAAQESSILSHMNADHGDNLKTYCQHVHGIVAVNAQMIGIDAEGFDVLCTTDLGKEHLLRFSFETPVLNAQDARKALVALAQQCKT
jgi:heme iron utilization protein